MIHTLNVKRQKQDFYSDGSGDYSYEGETIKICIEGNPDVLLIENIEEQIKHFKKIVSRNSKIYITKEVRTDWATFNFFCRKYKISVMHPNSCFYCTLEFANRRARFSIISPTINFDYNSFK